ncbi:GntR family transcriptional regulator [Burkholderia stagnalis]
MKPLSTGATLKVGAQAYQVLKAKILSNELPGGTQILEEALAAELNMSRTPLREALTRLENDGLIEIIPRHGVRILPLTKEDITEIYQVLSSLETTAAELIAERQPNTAEVALLRDAVTQMDIALKADDLTGWADADELFHKRLVELSGNRRLAAAALMLFDQSHRVRMFTLKLRDKPTGSVKNHGQLVDAIAKHDVDKVHRVHSEQRGRAIDTLLGLLSKVNVHRL